jgi:hypothetical protein
MPASAGSTKTTIRPATRATSLFTAEATPACWAGAAPRASVDPPGLSTDGGHRDLRPITIQSAGVCAQR